MNLSRLPLRRLSQLATKIVSCLPIALPLYLSLAEPSLARPINYDDDGNNRDYHTFDIYYQDAYYGTINYFEVQKLERVTIYGKSIEEEFQEWLQQMQEMQDILMMNSLLMLIQLSPQEQVAANADPRKDVRCSRNENTRQTTSQDSYENRLLAAIEMFRVYFLPTINPLNYNRLTGQNFRVTYADGGSDTWQIADPRSSIPFFPLPTNSSTGNGVAQPSPACSSTG
ncbi:hypothetical protein [Merismopedia glauca]|uniref:Uncharacterized protein n=1 Tax=Merismopedia glauca CCAP 1448/3 TaxID=1296344 RepID=A0A2T1C232_9CYAN|nr:hypothetical protein [Merismopedia glauca]PSB02345.1 hypothetical protein C7B64_13710 [Merismopedia glauca CCAP 1448/3]